MVEARSGRQRGATDYRREPHCGQLGLQVSRPGDPANAQSEVGHENVVEEECCEHTSGHACHSNSLSDERAKNTIPANTTCRQARR